MHTVYRLILQDYSEQLACSLSSLMGYSLFPCGQWKTKVEPESESTSFPPFFHGVTVEQKNKNKTKTKQNRTKQNKKNKEKKTHFGLELLASLLQNIYLCLTEPLGLLGVHPSPFPFHRVRKLV